MAALFGQLHDLGTGENGGARGRTRRGPDKMRGPNRDPNPVPRGHQAPPRERRRSPGRRCEGQVDEFTGPVFEGYLQPWKMGIVGLVYHGRNSLCGLKAHLVSDFSKDS